jgi:hypothetical protein
MDLPEHQKKYQKNVWLYVRDVSSFVKETRVARSVAAS